MWIKCLRVHSYYSFDDSDWVDLSPAINLIVGANNSGKTALLRCLSQSFANVPHRNTSRFRGSDLEASRIDVDVEIEWTSSFRVTVAKGVYLHFLGHRAIHKK